MLEAIIFDMDGLLFDTENVCAKAYIQVGKERNLKDIELVTCACVGLSAVDTKKVFLKHYGNDFDYDGFMERSSALIHDIIEANGLPMKSGVVELLNFLEENNYKIGLASSTIKEKVLKYLQRARIEHYFQAIVTGDMVTKSKPDPEIYMKACKELESVPECCIAIEDSPNGIKAAFSAGLKPIMVPDLIQPDEEIKKLLYGKFDSLLEVRGYFQNISKNI